MSENEQESFGIWLRREMSSRGYDVDSPRGGGRTALATEAGIAISIVSRLLSGERQPEIDTLRSIGRVFGYSLGEMLVVAGLAKQHEVATDTVESAASDTSPPRRFEALDGGRQDPSSYTEQMFYAEYGAGQRQFEYPPSGCQDEYERRVWAAPWESEELREAEFPAKWGVILAHRDEVAQQRAREAARRAREAQDERRRSNGA